MPFFNEFRFYTLSRVCPVNLTSFFEKKKCCHLLCVMTRRWNHSRRVKICLSSHIFSKWCSNFNCFVVFSLLNQWASVFEFTAAKSPDRVLGTSLNYLCVALISHGILNYILDWTEALYFVARCLSALGLNFRASNFAGISQLSKKLEDGRIFSDYNIQNG